MEDYRLNQLPVDFQDHWRGLEYPSFKLKLGRRSYVVARSSENSRRHFIATNLNWTDFKWKIIGKINCQSTFRGFGGV